MRDFPMPNDVIGERIVIASVWYNDDDEQVATVLLLNKESPFFVVGLLNLESGELEIVSDPIYNIVPAVRVYEDWGGDY